MENFKIFSKSKFLSFWRHQCTKECTDERWKEISGKSMTKYYDVEHIRTSITQ